MPLPFPAHGLYAITPDPRDFEQLKASLEAILAAGAGVVQLRDKQGRLSLRQGKELVALCHRFQVPLLVNDNVELARRIGADGVHLGRGDGSIAAARTRLGADAIIGVSCYGDLARAVACEAAGANYVAFGAFFPSPSKPEATPAPLSLLQRARKTLRLPIVAIGGITLNNAAALLAAGADLLAAISALFHAPDPGEAALRFHALCQRHR